MTTNGEVDAAMLFDAGLYNPETKSDDVRRWLRAEAYEDHGHHYGHGHDHAHGHHHHHDVNRHDSSIHATCLTFDEPLQAHAFERWLDILAAFKGADILRVKGIVNIAGEDRPVVIHGVQHVFHPPILLDQWPSDDRRTRLVFTTRNVTPDELQGTLALMTIGLTRFGLQGLVDNVPSSGLLRI